MATPLSSSNRSTSSETDAYEPFLASMVGDEAGVVEKRDDNRLADSDEEMLPSRYR